MVITAMPSATTNPELLSTDLRRMVGRPFGMDEAGRPINDGSGNLIVGAVKWMQILVGRRADQEVPAALSEAEREAWVAGAKSAALDRLVELLNDAIPDERYHVSREYLLNQSNNYSYEFRLFVAEYCRLVSEDPNFFYNEGTQSIPMALAHLARPLGIQGTYTVLPRLTAKYVKTDLRVMNTTPTSAVLRWYGASQLEKVPAEHRLPYIRYACQTYQGAFAAIPQAVFGMPRAEVRQVCCQIDGAEYCEWEFNWQPVEQSAHSLHLWAGVLISLFVLAYFLLRLPGWEGLGLVTVPLPIVLAWQWGRTRFLASERQRQAKLLLDQRDLSEAQYDRSEQAYAELQVANLELAQRISELTALHEIGTALSTTLELSELLDRSLRAVVSHLTFDRVLVLLVDEEREVLTEGRSVGGTPEIMNMVRAMEIPLSSETVHLVQIFRADHPLLFCDVDESNDEANRDLVRGLAMTSFLGTPLMSKGRRVGIMVVDNCLTGRPIPQSDADLLFTVGNQIATAVDNARLYQQIEAQNRTLEQRVQQRTRELAQATAEAEQARAAAEDANETKSAFLANVSHELRTPLTSVLGFTKIIQKRVDGVIFPNLTATDPKTQRAVGQVRDNLKIIISEGERLTAMINDVLDLAKIESGKLEWKSEPVNMAEIVEQAAGASSSLFAQKGLSLIVEVDHELPLVKGDANRLIQVVINLLSNAAKFTETGHVTCRATCTYDEIVVSVRDTGMGIAAPDHDKVFEQFKQVGDTLTDKPKGTGLGLPISKQIVEHHGGRIWLKSEPGSGSTFAFALPVIPESKLRVSIVETDTLIEQLQERTTLHGRAAGHKRILIVDDDDRIRELLRQELEAGGYHVQQARDGREGLLAAQAEPPDLIILDVLMPEMNGFEVTVGLKSDPRTASVPLVLLTVVDNPDRAYRLGVDHYFTKPFDPEALVHQVGMLVARGLEPTPGQ